MTDFRRHIAIHAIRPPDITGGGRKSTPDRGGLRRREGTARCLLVIIAALLAAGCQATAPAPAPTGSPGDVTIQVASNGWHTAIVLPAETVPVGAIPEAADFPEARWLSLGWGDAEYFPARDETLGMTLRAALLPTPAVVLLGGPRRAPGIVWPRAEIVALPVSREGLRRLIDYLAASFDRGGKTRASSVAPGPEPFSRFYPATGTFHLFNTCNTWTARGLAVAGLPVEVFGTISAEDLMAQLRGLSVARRTSAVRARGPAGGRRQARPGLSFSAVPT